MEELTRLIEKYGPAATIGYVREQERRTESVEQYMMRVRLREYQLRQCDVGRRISDNFGKVQSGDVGKFCGFRDYGLVVESVEQRNGTKPSPFR